MANIHDINRDEWMLRGPLAKKGYDWWWHSMTAENAETGELKPFYVEFFTCNPALAEDDPVIVWNDPEAQKAGKRPSYGAKTTVSCTGFSRSRMYRSMLMLRTAL